MYALFLINKYNNFYVSGMIKDDIGNRNIIFNRQDKRKSAEEE